MAHAYLFSGPRGTGKTSTARILAKALNCTDLQDGEPCGVCPSCVEITKGTSLDVHELDAASNNGVDAMRDLVSRAALGTPGRQKVYIVDEVHMLSTRGVERPAEDPGGAAGPRGLRAGHHRSAEGAAHHPQPHPALRVPAARPRDPGRPAGQDVRRDAHLDVPDEALDLAVRRGRGSARDALSVLDQVAASDTVDDDLPELDEVVEALAERDVGRALVAVAHLTSAGFSPQQLAGDLVDHLRQGFLALVAPDLVAVAGAERDAAGRAGRAGSDWPPWSGPWRCWARPRSPCGTPPIPGSTSRWPWSAWPTPRPMTRPRPCWPGSSASSAGRAGPPRPPAPAPAHRSGADGRPRPPHPSTGPGRPSRRPAGPGTGRSRPPRPPVRRAAPQDPGCGPPASRPRRRRPPASARRRSAGPAGPGDRAPGRRPPAAPVAAAGDPSRALPDPRPAGPGLGRPRHRSAPAQGQGPVPGGRFVGVEEDRAVFGLPNEIHRTRCEEVRGEVESALAEHFGRPVGWSWWSTPTGAGAGPAGPAATGSDPPVPTGPTVTRPPAADAATTPRRRPRSRQPTPDPTADEDPRTSSAFDESELGEVADVDNSAESRVLQAFPGAEEVG